MSKGLKYTLYGILTLDIIGILLALLFNTTLLSDDFEHLQMSNLVSQGYVPYRDFFEHHHPLLWYLFAPFMTILPQNLIAALYFARFFALAVRMVMLYFIYMMFKKFFNDKKLMLYFLLVVFSFYPLWYGFSYFKPDIFEQMFYFMGLYWFFRYIDGANRKDLIISGIHFTVAFLFLQTAIFGILPLFIVFVYVAKNSSRAIKDFLSAMIIPLFLTAGIIIYMYNHEILERYFELNWIFNLNINLCDAYIEKDSVLPLFLIPLLLGAVSWIWILKTKRDNIYINTIALLYIFSVAEHIVFKATFPHYLIMTLIYCAILISLPLKYMTDKKHTLYIGYVAAYFFISLIINNFITYLYSDYPFMKIIYYEPDISKSGFNIDNILPQVYSKRIHYYVMRNELHELDDYLFNRYPEYDINKMIQKYKPVYIDYKAERKEQKINNSRFEITPETLKYYKQVTPNANIWRRRDILSQ